MMTAVRACFFLVLVASPWQLAMAKRMQSRVTQDSKAALKTDSDSDASGNASGDVTQTDSKQTGSKSASEVDLHDEASVDDTSDNPGAGVHRHGKASGQAGWSDSGNGIKESKDLQATDTEGRGIGKHETGMSCNINRHGANCETCCNPTGRGNSCSPKPEYYGMGPGCGRFCRSNGKGSCGPI
eukprot:gnl/MRDRNA2_/MRDRNA2_51379_c0_seq1.p1 gnl/MRDRNA2_/MRDRNA2_51379_c0~~gnl/MRDRNA2_/MRDRNA2_51379_c0_seq1.p1  ORF type:complete len:184 (-),score=27.06 gnl/MRDRNA2_/MRDRNA2_51379_c0_seq1:169-720(-)